MFCEESLGKVNAKDLELFRNRLAHEPTHRYPPFLQLIVTLLC